MRKFSSILLFFFLATHAWAETDTIDFNGGTFSPEIHNIQGRTFYDTADRDVLALLARANITTQWSSSGITLFAFAPGRETYWTTGSETCKVNNEEVPSPGRLIQQNGKTYIEPMALFYAMATRGTKTASGYKLAPVLTQISQTDTGFLLRSAARAKPKLIERGEQTVFAIDGFDWDGEENSLSFGDNHFEISGGAEKGRPLTLTVTTPAFYTAELAGATLLNEIKLNVVPNFPDADIAAEVTLQKMYSADNDGNPMLVLEFDSGAKLHYHKDLAKGDLTLYVPKASFQADDLDSDDWNGVEIATSQTPKYSVLEITIPIGRHSYEFVTLEDAPHSLALVKGAPGELEELAATGSVETPGRAVFSGGGTIVIDPGHGGSDPGCVNRTLGTREADVTLAISMHLAEILRQQGWNVVLTRETDRDVTYAGSPDRMELEARSAKANEMGADLFMSVHCNASVNSGAHGSSIHWWKPEDYAFAQALEPVLGPAIGLGQQGLIRNRFVVLRHAQMPSVLVETAFLTNPREGAKLSDPEFQKLIARQLAGGLASYMQGVYASRGNNRRVD